MKNKIIILLALVLLLTIGCMNTKDSDIIGCYKIKDDPDNAMIIIKGGEEPTLTLKDDTGQEPMVSTGRIEDSIFIYIDGAKFHFDENKAWGEGELIGEIEAEKIQCE